MLIYLQMLESPEEKSILEQIYLEYRGLMYHVAYEILHNEQDAEDAVHHAFVKIAENIKKITDPVCPKTHSYVVTIVPFSVFKDYYEDLLKSPVYFFVTLINFFGNLAMFIPIGFFSALLFRNATLKRSAIIGFGMSTFIEFAQYFIMRNTAVDDIILNTLGAICGYWVYRLLRKMFPGFSREFICNITQAAGN